MEPVDQNENVEELEDIGAIQTAEYVVFLIAYHTYSRYVSEHKGEDYTDDLLKSGHRLVKMADRALADTVKGYFLEHLTSQSHKNQVIRAFRLPSTKLDNVLARAEALRQVLKRGEAYKHIFKGVAKAQREIKAAMTASVMDDADAALKVLAGIPVLNARIRKWIDDADAMAGSKQFLNPVSLSAAQAVEAAPAILQAQATQDSVPGTEAAVQAVTNRDAAIAQVQSTVTAEAQRALAASGVEDKPPTLSEVHGIVAATIAASKADPEIPANLPAAFINNGRPLDPEQIQAALTGGRVLVAAGAGAGKSTTLVSRIAYLISDKGQDSGKILACSFNKKAALQLKGKIQSKVGVNNVRCSTMHALFLNFVVGNSASKGLGTEEEKAMLKHPRLISDEGGIKSSALSVTIYNMWNNCGTEALAKRYDWIPQEWLEDGPPKAKAANQLMNVWRGNGVTLEMAKDEVRSQGEALAYIWYEMYLGLKGDIPGWKPPCYSKSHENFMKKYRRGGERLGDMEDMQATFLDILKRDPEKRERIQRAFDHMLVDEAQDLNLVQHSIFEIMSANVTADNGKSIWMIGDDKQCIYQFRGSRPEQFGAFKDKEGWVTRLIRTNYRCEPEIVEAANRLASHNQNNLQMECRARPDKSKGQGSITVDTPPDAVGAAIDAIGSIVQEHKHGTPLEKFAVLARTNKELNDYETACIINEIPYAKIGKSGFLDASETQSLLGYIDLAQGTSFKSMRKSLAASIMMPNRGFYGNMEDFEQAIDRALTDLARYTRKDKDSLDPRLLLEDRQGKRALTEALKAPYKAKIGGGWDRAVQEGIASLEQLGGDLRHITNAIQDNPSQPTSALLDTILDGVSGTSYDRDQATNVTQTLREAITVKQKLWGSDEDDDDVEEEKSEEEKAEALQVDDQGHIIDPDKAPVARPGVYVPGAGLGAVQFLFKLAVPNDNDGTHGTDPSTAAGFISKIGRYKELADKLRIDPKKWEKEHGDKPIPAVTLSTVHRVKGAEWENVTVVMPKGTFPMERKPKKGEPPPDPEKEGKRIEAERNLAYVALTRAQVNLKIICPLVTSLGMQAGISSFVTEAGLVPGENVKKQLGSEGLPEGTAPEVKTASHSFDDGADYYLESLAASMLSNYDRRGL